MLETEHFFIMFSSVHRRNVKIWTWYPLTTLTNTFILISFGWFQVSFKYWGSRAKRIMQHDVAFRRSVSVSSVTICKWISISEDPRLCFGTAKYSQPSSNATFPACEAMRWQSVLIVTLISHGDLNKLKEEWSLQLIQITSYPQKRPHHTTPRFAYPVAAAQR